MWKLVELGSKYYGTIIKDLETGVEIKIWHTFLGGENSFVPSDRELSKANITREQWDSDEVITTEDCFGDKVTMNSKEIVIAADHFEDQESYERALLILETLNTKG